jgi:hypothetical protein
MTVIKQKNPTTSVWETILVGEQGPQGPQGIQGPIGTGVTYGTYSITDDTVTTISDDSGRPLKLTAARADGGPSQTAINAINDSIIGTYSIGDDTVTAVTDGAGRPIKLTAARADGGPSQTALAAMREAGGGNFVCSRTQPTPPVGSGVNYWMQPTADGGLILYEGTF